jgi:hypothetical protein
MARTAAAIALPIAQIAESTNHAVNRRPPAAGSRRLAAIPAPLVVASPATISSPGSAERCAADHVTIGARQAGTTNSSSGAEAAQASAAASTQCRSAAERR